MSDIDFEGLWKHKRVTNNGSRYIVCVACMREMNYYLSPGYLFPRRSWNKSLAD